MAAAVVKGRGTLGGVGGDQRELEVFGRMLRWTDDAVDKKFGVENTSKRFDHVSGWARSRNHPQFGRQNKGIVKS